jgi:cell division initiation protein
MPLTPVEVRHFDGLSRGLFGYKKQSVHSLMDEVADSFESVWRERAELVERVESLETELGRHVELESLLRATLVSAERASQETREQARREAEVIVSEANTEARRLLRDAITEKERLLGEIRRIRSLLRSALEVIDDVPRDAPPETAESAALEPGAPGAHGAEPEPAPEEPADESTLPGAMPVHETDAADDDDGHDTGMHRLVG